MKLKSRIACIVLLFITSSWIQSFGQQVNVKDIINNPAAFDGEVVEVTGLVTQYIEASDRTTAHYLLKGNYGAIIRVNTAEGEPEINAKYTTTGIVYMDKNTQLPFISEKSRVRLDVIEPQEAVTDLDAESGQPAKWYGDNLLLIIIIGGGIIMVILLILLISKRKPAAGEPIVSRESKPSDAITTEKEELKTMVIPKPADKTMKFIPGQLEILTGEDKGRSIKIAGFPTEDGSIVTIGRESVTGPRDFAHIEMKERTISRKQAELIYKDGKLYIKNLSETNYTKLNGKDIPPNTSLEISTDAVLTFGEVEMKYKV